MFIPRKAQVLIQYNTKRGYKPWRGCPRPHKKPTNNSYSFCHVITICPEKNSKGYVWALY